METILENIYCSSLTEYARRSTVEVRIGEIPMGGSNPIRVQSMVTVDTMDTQASVDQSIRMIEAGCEYVRLTAPSINEAKNLQNIQDILRSKGFNQPLIADIHFTPNAAETAARIVDKVRINPGNYADRKKFEVLDFTDQTYNDELERIRDKFIPLINICKEYGTALRIGTNHGSLSDRIMSRYGDTPLGMVESALEFLRICEDENYHQIVLSMKASNPQVMVQAYRMLVQRMDQEGIQPYPLHLGVTEAGEGEDGRIKSAVGIGTLLEDGLGDTVRVSLTEEPEFEIPIALELVNRYAKRAGHLPIEPIERSPVDPFVYTKNSSREVRNLGNSNVPRVISDFQNYLSITIEDLPAIGHRYLAEFDKWIMDENGSDYLFAGDLSIDFELPNGLKAIVNYDKWVLQKSENQFPFFVYSRLEEITLHPTLNFVEVLAEEMSELDFHRLDKENIVIVLVTKNEHAMPQLRRFFFELKERGIQTPVVVKREYDTDSLDKFQVYSSTDVGGLMLDGFGNGTWISFNGNQEYMNSTAFGILQATRTRITRTEYISCPSCGRTLFDLQETTAKIRKETDHLKGVKIAIMGCIVNGPGEMADADYGYVGAGPNKITLYKGKEVRKKGIPFDRAVGELIGLIKSEGDWMELESN